MTLINLHISALSWLHGADTSDIAKQIRLPESVVYNCLDAIRKRAGMLRREVA